MRIGVDTGGTFTDFVFWEGSRLRSAKIRSTPADPSRAILAGLAAAEEIVHGSTVATNALLEGRGARTALATTEGFEDLLEIGRQQRPSLYDWFAAGRPSLIPRELRFGLPERILADGSIARPLASEAIERLAAELRAADVESVAVCLLHAHAEPAHEQAVGEALRARGFFVSLSHEVLPEYREYERASTTAVNAYVSPLMGRYLKALERDAPGTPRLRVFQSSGGSMSVAMAARSAVHTVLSGPAGGVQGAVAIARAAGMAKFISFDMGGTSTDVCLVEECPTLTSEGEIAGLPIRARMIDIHTVGAGGGSIAWFDVAGALKAGPRSAGAEPGPACYGAGEEATVTDANLVLGRIDPERFLGGAMKLDVDRAARAIERLARRAGTSIDETADAIVAVANAGMERAIRKVSVERGRDPREFALIAFGGAGAQHACELADRLEIRTVLIPRQAGVLSALGMLSAEFSRDYSLDLAGRGEEEAYAELERRAAEEFAEERVAELRFERSIDLRYRGQSFEITVPFAERDRFDEAHQRLYGYRHVGREIEAVAARLTAVAASDRAAVDPAAADDDSSDFTSIYETPGRSRTIDRAGNTVLTR